MKTTDIQDAAMMAAPLTAGELVKIANVLIDEETEAWGRPDTCKEFHAGALKGILTMCKAATSALNACGENAATQQAGLAPAEQHGDAQSNQQVKPQSDGPGQRPTTTQQAGLIFSNRPHSSKILGEHCAGTIVDITTGVVYEVMVMPGELTCATWDEAKRTIQAAGGDLPTPVEMSMIGKLLGRIAFQESYWVNEKVKFDGDVEESFSYFSDGVFDFSDAKDRMSARGIRRISIGDVADENLDEVDDNTVIVQAPVQFSGNSGKLAPGPDLSDRPDLQAMRAALTEQVEPITMEAVAAVLDELNGIIDADDEGDTIETLAPAIRVINGLVLIADMDKLRGAASEARGPTGGAGILTRSKLDALELMQERASKLLEATGLPTQTEAAGALRSAMVDMWEAVDEQLAITALPMALDNWMATPAGLARVLIDALRKERIEEPGEYNDAVEDCITAVLGTLSAGGDKEVGYQKQLAKLSAIAPKVPVDDVVDAMNQLQAIGKGQGEDSALGQTCALAVRVINGLVPHAGFGVEA